MKRSVILGAFGAALVLAGGAVAAAAAVDAKTVITERRAGLKAMGEAQKAIDGELKSSAAVDWAKVRASAKVLNDNAPKIQTWFPAGSNQAAGVETKARPEIWTDNAKFMSIAKGLPAETAKVVAAANGSNKDALQTAFNGLTCRECHMSFRAR